MPLQASIGKHRYSATQCYNLPQDQLRVANLLDLITPDQGGTDGNLMLSLDKIRWGIVDEKLYQALQRFQQRQFGSSDGHVEPGERTIRKLEDLAFAQNPTKTADPTTNTPDQPDFKLPTPTDMPNPTNPILDWAGKGFGHLKLPGIDDRTDPGVCDC